MHNAPMRLLWRLIKLVLALALLLALAAVIFLFWASRGYNPEAPAAEPVTNEELLATLNVTENPEEIRILSYNVAYGRGPEDDIGDRRSEAEVRGFLSALAGFLRTHGADVVALQEVDFGARRTYHIDQLEFLAHEAGYPYTAWITTWKANYVPFPYWPPSQHIGRIHSGQAILSRYPILSNRRVVLPQPEAYPFYYNLFYLHRAIQAATVRVGERDITLFNSHLEAFDLPNRERHAELLVETVRETEVDDWLVLGDMNSVPPEAPQKTDFVDEPGWDATDDRTIEILRAGLGVLESPGLEAYTADQRPTFTFPADAPTRRLDYLFASSTLPLSAARIVAEAGSISDHLPVGATVRLSPPDLPQRTIRPAPLPNSEDDR
jgi:endonuclease/exonuclease/phosphatase family metal-dependent hydrolase